MSNQYETVARNSGKSHDEVEKTHEEVQKTFGKYLKTPELIWWQVCNRLKIKVDPPAQNRGGGGGNRESKNISLKDIELLSNKENVNVEGMVLWATHDMGDGTAERPERYTIGLVDATAKSKVSGKNPEMIDVLKRQNIQPGDFVKVSNGFGWVLPIEDGREKRGVALTKMSQVQVTKKFNPIPYFVNPSSEGLEHLQPCVVQGIVLNSKIVNFDGCPTKENGKVCGKGHKKGEDVCFFKHENKTGEWLEIPNTFLTVHDENGAFEVSLEGSYNYNGMEVVVVGQNVIKGDGSQQIRALNVSVKDVVVIGSAALQKDTAKAGVLKSLKSFGRLPRDSVLKRIREEGIGNDTEAESLLSELVTENKVKVEGTYVRFVSV